MERVDRWVCRGVGGWKEERGRNGWRKCGSDTGFSGQQERPASVTAFLVSQQAAPDFRQCLIPCS
jgi:hypothetical protein